MSYYTYNNELCHFGIKGQKWGIRRYQNKDGSRTAVGKKREKNNNKKLSNKQKIILGAAAVASVAGLYIAIKNVKPNYNILNDIDMNIPKSKITTPSSVQFAKQFKIQNELNDPYKKTRKQLITEIEIAKKIDPVNGVQNLMDHKKQWIKDQERNRKLREYLKDIDRK